MLRSLLFSSIVCLAMWCAAVASAGTTYTFEELPVGTAVTNQYAGVTFSVVGQTCSGNPTLYMRIRTPSGGTSSGTRALGIDTGCPDFSSDYLRMVFDIPQQEVSFTVGDYATTYTVRAYTTTSGGSPVSTQTITVPGSGIVGVHRFVRVLRPGFDVRRIEIATDPAGLFEWIDDLTFDVDTTPPVAEITSPGPVSCVCSGVTIFGRAFDPDGPFGSYRLERAAVGSDAWVLIATSSTPVPDGAIATWNTAAVEGFYLLRLTVDNAAGLRSTATTVVWLSRTFDTVSFGVPAILGGTACPDGTVFDSYCGADSYRVEYAAPGGVYSPVDPANPTYAGTRVNQQLASWNTRRLPDGPYNVRVTGVNPCGQAQEQVQQVIVDNTAPSVLITSPLSCRNVARGMIPIRGSVSDAHVDSWVLQYTGGPAHNWITIASGNSAVNGLLGTWNTAGLPPCEYTLRLVASDLAIVNCDNAIRNSSEYTVSVAVGCPADLDDGSGLGIRDGGVTLDDLLYFLLRYESGC